MSSKSYIQRVINIALFSLCLMMITFGLGYAVPNQPSPLEPNQPSPLEPNQPSKEWRVDRLKRCYFELDYKCAGDEIQEALARTRELSPQTLVEVRAYQALIAFSYQDHRRVKHLLEEMIALDPNAQLPKEAPKSMRLELESLRPQPFISQLWISLLGGAVFLVETDATQWHIGEGAQLVFGVRPSSLWSLEFSVQGRSHEAINPYMRSLDWGGGGLTLWYIWESAQKIGQRDRSRSEARSRWQAEVGVGLYAVYLHPQGDLFVQDRWGAHIQTPVRFGVRIHPRLFVFTQLNPTQLFIPDDDVLAWSFIIETSLGVRWEL